MANGSSTLPAGYTLDAPTVPAGYTLDPPAGQPNIKGLVADPDFQRLDPASQRQALTGVTGDQSFAGLSDSDTAHFISRMGGTQSSRFVGLPDGRYIDISDATPDQLAQLRTKLGAQFGQNGGATQPNPYLQGAENVAIGAGKGLLNTVSGVSTLINKLPWVGETLAPSQGIKAMQQMKPPQGAAQKAGYYGEQATEFLAPGLGEEDAALAAAKALPWMGKAAPVAGRLAAQSVGSGAVNALQGGSFATGAAAGAGSGVLGEGIRAVAPKLAESALGVTQKMRSPSKTIGQAVLDETSGLTPGAIASSASAKVAALTNQLESAAAASQNVASLQPALDVLDKAEQVAKSRNSAAMLGKVNAVRQQLTQDISTGQAIPQNVPPSQLLNLKRGIGDLISTWQPQEKAGFNGTLQKVYGALDGELDKAVPESADLNQQISSLIPAKTRAKLLSNSAPITQRVAGRLARPTGALVGAGAGGAFGYREGGTPGAVTGALTGLVAPEILSSPTTQMAAARAAQSGAPGYVLPWMRGLVLQADRPSREQLPWVSQ